MLSNDLIASLFWLSAPEYLHYRTWFLRSWFILMLLLVSYVIELWNTLKWPHDFWIKCLSELFFENNTVLGVFMLLFAKIFHHDSRELVDLGGCLKDQWYSFKKSLGSRSFRKIRSAFIQQVDNQCLSRTRVLYFTNSILMKSFKSSFYWLLIYATFQNVVTSRAILNVYEPLVKETSLICSCLYIRKGCLSRTTFLVMT